MTDKRDRNNWQLTEDINLRELECPCCGRVMISRVGVLKLQKVRDELGESLCFTSGYRCGQYNQKVSGHPKSLHKRGLAWDIKAKDVKRQLEVIAKYFPFYYHNKERGYIHIQAESSLG